MKSVAVGRKLVTRRERCRERRWQPDELVHDVQNLQVDAFAYLRDVLERISTHPARRIGELLPDQWTKERVEADVAPAGNRA